MNSLRNEFTQLVQNIKNSWIQTKLILWMKFDHEIEKKINTFLKMCYVYNSNSEILIGELYVDFDNLQPGTGFFSKGFQSFTRMKI